MAVRRNAENSTLASDADVAAGAAALARKCPVMRRLVRVAGPLKLRRSVPGFPGLAATIVAQQVSRQSAEAIWSRTRALIQPFEPRVLLSKTEAELKSAGLSAPKIRTLVAVARAIEDERLDLSSLDQAPEAEIVSALTAISGIGPWTAGIYTMFCLGRADAFASGDLALQLAARAALGLERKPAAVELEALAERWRPWRGVAALALWAWYAHPGYKVRCKTLGIA
jgi:DNA-3-methyladenine glycosylase II